MHQEKKMLAHISEDGTRVQTVADHLQGTAVLCGQFAAAFDAQQQGTWLGLLHDIGKYSTKFQRRLQGGEKVDHSTAGAQVAARYGQIPLAFAIAGHHSGLPDGGGGGHVRRIAGELDAVEQQNGLHGIGQQVHEGFL